MIVGLMVYVNVFMINVALADYCRRYHGSFCILFISLSGYRVTISNSVATRVLIPFLQFFLSNILFATFKPNCMLATSRLKLFETFISTPLGKKPKKKSVTKQNPLISLKGFSRNLYKFSSSNNCFKLNLVFH